LAPCPKGFAANNPAAVPTGIPPLNQRQFSFQPEQAGFSGKTVKEAYGKGAASKIPEHEELPFISPNHQ